ncbi:MAG: SDR family NAD(P)-dependent oxidoreductase [Deltaproteobacteria bacterium]
MNTFAEKFGPWAVVTGASSGIGEAFCRRLASAGMNLVLVARREELLRRLAGRLEIEHGVKTRIVAVDLAGEGFLTAIEAATADIAIGLLVNNAGFATSGPFLDNDVHDEVAMLHLNARAPLVLAHRFGRLMRERRKGGIIFISSILGFSGVPAWSHYAATKAFDQVLAEGLALELRQDGVSVLAVAPGPTQTAFWRNSTPRLVPFASPDRVAQVALGKLGRRSAVTAGWRNSLIVFSTRLLPRPWNVRIFGLVMRLLSRTTAQQRASHSSTTTRTVCGSLTRQGD